MKTPLLSLQDANASNPSAALKLTGIADLFNLENLPAAKSFRAYMASSYDREGGNYDWGNYELVIGQDGIVMDVDGPGIITRIWSANPAGQIKIYMDKNDSPVVDEPFEQFMKRLPLRWGTGRLDPNTPEFKEAMAALKPGGYTTYCPMAFNDGCKIVLSPAPEVYYQVNYLLCDTPHSLPTFSNQSMKTEEGEYDRVLNQLNQTKVTNSEFKRSRGRCSLKAGEKHVIFDQEESFTIRELSIKTPWPKNESQSKHLKEKLLLRGFWDEDLFIDVRRLGKEDLSIGGLSGRRRASIKSPLAAFFMDFGAHDSYETAVISKSGDQYTCRFPMPICTRGVIELWNTSCIDTQEIEYEIVYDAQSTWNKDSCHFKALYHYEDSTFGYDLGKYSEVMYLRNQNDNHNYPILRTYG